MPLSPMYGIYLDLKVIVKYFCIMYKSNFFKWWRFLLRTSTNRLIKRYFIKSF